MTDRSWLQMLAMMILCFAAFIIPLLSSGCVPYQIRQAGVDDYAVCRYEAYAASDDYAKINELINLCLDAKGW